MIHLALTFAHGAIARDGLAAAVAARDAALAARETRRVDPRARVQLQCPACFARAAVEPGSPARLLHARPGCAATPFIVVLEE